SNHPENLEGTKSPPFTPVETVPPKNSLQAEPSGSRSNQENRAKFIKVNNPDIEKSNLLKRLAEEVLKEYPHPEKKRLLLSITESDGKLSDEEEKKEEEEEK
ncbi:hypothetical protein DPMN_041071, partial [Dreissena polymorpha]